MFCDYKNRLSGGRLISQLDGTPRDDICDTRFLAAPMCLGPVIEQMKICTSGENMRNVFLHPPALLSLGFLQHCETGVNKLCFSGRTSKVAGLNFQYAGAAVALVREGGLGEINRLCLRFFHSPFFFLLDPPEEHLLFIRGITGNQWKSNGISQGMNFAVKA